MGRVGSIFPQWEVTDISEKFPASFPDAPTTPSGKVIPESNHLWNNSLQKMYVPVTQRRSTNLKQHRLCELVRDEEAQWEARLKALVMEEEKNKWRRIAEKMQRSEVGCKNQAKQMGITK